ncbi:hypothetical protein Q2T40_14895 [Winogradskyella maritima]|uniref:Heme-binding HmuY-like protein n=1 Tax=Winogradskyella maritima TaxID=1517766 RepID=A0ABV8AJW7_9FLAO|nr:hypothetical protein [Winogradskyella maritima]
MTFRLLYLFAFLAFASCKSDKNERIADEPTPAEPELTTAEKIAKAHGYDNWQHVNTINFTFNVDRGGDNKRPGRAWAWAPQPDAVQFFGEDETIAYTRASMDSTKLKTDQAFINDKYWLLVPFQLVWDNTATLSEPVTKEAPISKTEMNMITITYPSEGGYTPGDAYDIFYDDDYMIREWVFRKGNAEEPSMMTTFENYKNYNGIMIATEHKMPDSDFNLYFDKINVTLNK